MARWNLTVLLAASCAQLQVIGDKPEDTDEATGRDSDTVKDPVPDETAIEETGDDDPTPTDDTEETDDTGPVGPLVMLPVSFSYFVQLAWTDAGAVSTFTYNNSVYISGLFIEFQDAQRRTCTVPYGFANGAPAPDAERQAWLSGLGLLAGVTVAPGSFVPYAPYDANGVTCTFDPSTTLATDPHTEMLRDPVSTEIRPMFVGIGDTLSTSWTIVLQGQASLSPPIDRWATGYLRLPFDVTTQVTGGPTLVGRDFELGTRALSTDAQMVVQTSGSQPVHTDPGTWDTGTGLRRGVYLLESFTITF